MSDQFYRKFSSNGNGGHRHKATPPYINRQGTGTSRSAPIFRPAVGSSPGLAVIKFNRVPAPPVVHFNQLL